MVFSLPLFFRHEGRAPFTRSPEPSGACGVSPAWVPTPQAHPCPEGGLVSPAPRTGHNPQGRKLTAQGRHGPGIRRVLQLRHQYGPNIGGVVSGQAAEGFLPVPEGDAPDSQFQGSGLDNCPGLDKDGVAGNIPANPVGYPANNRFIHGHISFISYLIIIYILLIIVSSSFFIFLIIFFIFL
jgi:hypothetical protein